MKKQTNRKLRPALLAVILAVFAAPQAFAQIIDTDKIRPAGKLPPAVKIDPEVVDPRTTACPDPAAFELDANLVARSTTWPDFNGTVDIVGLVRNVGRGNYASGRGQQSVELLEQWPGSSPSVIETATFTHLNAGTDIRVTYRQNWVVSREFPPRYTLRISYDPDIRIDGNPRNDDCRLNNNETAIEPRQIDVVFE